MTLKLGIAAALAVAVAATQFSAAEERPAATVTSVNLASLKAIFDNAKVPATLEGNGTAVRFIQAELVGYWILAVPVECPNKDQDGACKGVALLSAGWNNAPGLEKLAAFTREHQRLSMPITTPAGQPILRYVFMVSEGVAPNYVENRMADFYYEQKEFEQAVFGQSSTTPGFSVASGGKAQKSVDVAAALAALPEPHPGGKLAP